MDDLTSKSATKLAALIKSGAVSPLEVIEAYWERIERLNPSLNAIVTLAPDALDRAREAQSAVSRGDDPGPLHGVPLTVKDTIETAGLLTTSGSRVRAEFVPEKDAPAVARLKAAGAIILGKTNPAEMAMDYTADNPVFGRTNNPHDFARTPGGSSGGEAAAISSCMSPAGLGSDLAGSIRIPCHCCGIAGLKPSTGRVPSAGQFPPAIGPYALGAVIGPMARFVEDLYLLFSVLSGPEIPPLVTPKEALQNKAATLRGWRVAWYADDGVIPVTRETERAVEAAARVLAEAGLVAQQVRPPGVERALDLWLKLFSHASVLQLREVYAGHEEDAGAFVRFRLETADKAAPPTLDEYITAWMERDRLRAGLIDWLDATLLVTPVGATPALKHDAHKVTVKGHTFSTFRAFSYSQAFSVFDLSAVCVPAGRTPEGLPLGVQIIGRPGEEETVLAAALIVEEAFGGWQPPPLSDKL